MARFSKGRLLSATSAFTIAAFAATGAQAQDASNQTDDTDDMIVEEVVVTGIRRNLGMSIEDKREAGQIIDTINAEDIGKSTDQNIAEALGRVPGVTVNMVNGEGTSISVRGANANQTVITMNGQPLSSTGFSQGVNLSNYSADILSKIEVVKTPSADHEEGSLGATVNLVTRKPLDIDENIRTATVQGRYGDLSEEFDHKLSGTFSHKFSDDTIGLIVTIVDESYSARRDSYHANDYNVFGSYIYTDENGNSFTNQAALNAEAAASAMDGRENQFSGLTAMPVFDRSIWTYGGAADAYGDIVKGIAPSNTGYQLNESETKRTGIDATLQFEFGDRTDLTISGTYNSSEFESTMDGLFMPTSIMPGHIDTVYHPGLWLPANFSDRSEVYAGNPPELGGNMLDGDGNPIPGSNRIHPWTDPAHQWRVLDTRTQTWSKFLNRHAAGSTQASVNDYESTNSLLSAELNHAFTDNFRFKVGAAHTEAEQEPGTNIFISASRNRTVSPWNLHHVPADIMQPAGYDCSAGACRLVGGTTSPDLGTIVDLQPDSTDLWDNIGSTGFNPDDLASHTLNWISSTVTEVSDEQTSGYADFDWDIDWAGFTTIEFGAKYTEREKYVNNQSGTPAPSDELIEAESPFTGEIIYLDPNRIDLISAEHFADGIVDASGFMRGLGVPTDHLTDGWSRFDPVAALDAVTEGDRSFTLDNTQTRSAKFETLAGYLKASFSFANDRLRGDIGVRYVETDVRTKGYAGAVFAPDSDGRVIDPVLLHRMRESDQSNRCPELSDTPDPNVRGEASDFWTGEYNDDGTPAQDFGNFQDRNRWARVDGNGWDTNLTQGDYSDDTPLPAVPGGLCYDPLLEPGALPGTMVERNLVRYGDISTEERYVYDRQVDANGNLVSVDRSRAGIPASDEHTYDKWLPSLNLSFLATDDLILRFATSKTMTRPNIDSLRAGFRMTEGSIFEAQNIFRPGSRVELYGARLDPLESTNFDFSVEWYFQDNALLAANFFHKSVKDMEEVQDSRWYIGDLRRIAADPDSAAFENGVIIPGDGQDPVPLLLTPAGAGGSPDMLQCMPRRLRGESTLANALWMFSGDSAALCDEYNITRRVNSEDAEINGIELQYTQNFAFLPGIWGGLGTTMNFTYQEGEFDGSEFEIPGTPQESYNLTAFWAQNGHQARLAWSGSSDVLMQRSFGAGASWQEGRDVLDFSASYQMTDTISWHFDAQNITDEPVRQYFTSRILELPDASGNLVTLDEGSAIGGNAPKNRTLLEYNTGVIYRLAVRFDF